MTITSSKKLNNTSVQAGIFESYVMKLPEILIVALIAFFDLAAVPFFYRLEPLFYGCYVFFFVGVIMIFEFLKKRSLVIPGLILMSLVLILISRDTVITVNILLALAVVFFILFLALSKWKKTAYVLFAVFVVANVIACAVNGIDNRYAIVCLVVGTFYCISYLIRKDIDYRFAVTLALILVVLLPIREEPIQWTVVKDVYYKAMSVVDDIGNEIGYRVSGIVDFGGSYSGYSGVGTLNGSLKKGSREELTFLKSGGTNRTTYLKGSDYSTITAEGLTGKNSISPDYNDWFILYMNALMDADISNKEARCFARIESAEVVYEYLRTEDIIRPSNLLNIDNSVENGLKKKAGKGFDYKLQYMLIDYTSPYFQRALEGASSQPTHSYNEVKEYTFDTFKINISRFMSQEKYDEAVKRLGSDEYKEELSLYLDTSMSTDEIKKLSNELTYSCEDDYTKAKVIESYLRNYKYDTSVDLRGTDNYVASFLFDTKSGYCVHFASAMVLLLREAGVPARYVSGYLYNGTDTFVKSGDAHAWVEAYIEGMGWMTFEPTATMESAEDLSWGLVVKETDESDRTDWGEYYQDETIDEVMEEGAQATVQPDESAADPVVSSEENAEIVKQVLIYVVMIVGAVAALFLVVFLGRLIWLHFLPPERKLGEMVKKACAGIEKKLESQDKQKKKKSRTVIELKNGQSSIELEKGQSAARQERRESAREIIKRLHKNSSSIYDYLEYVDNDEERANLRELFDKYYRVRFRR